MSRQLHRDPDPSQALGCRERTPRQALVPLGAALGAALLMTACTAPGMKFDAKPSAQGEVQQMGGLKVTLRRLDPAVLKSMGPRSLDSAPLSELVSDKVQIYQVGPADVLIVTVWDHPEITMALGQYRTDNAAGTLVDEEGYIYFPYIGRFQVNGLTSTEIRTLITTKLTRVLNNPQVDVKVLAFRSKKIYVGGEVKLPAVYTVTDVPFTLAEALNRAGGFNPGADDSRMLLIRGDRTWTLNFQSLMAQSRLAGKIFLQDGDSLIVPNSLENPVYLMGEVVKPGPAPLAHGNLTLAKAILDGGGVSGTSADARSIYVIRQGKAANAVDVFHLDARNPTAMVLADQFALNPRDIVYVDAGTTVRFSRVMALVLPTISAVSSTATGVGQIHYFYK